MKKIKFIAMLFIATLVFVSCQNEDTLDNKDATSTEKYPVIVSKLQKMHFNTSDLKAVDITLPDGTKQDGFQFENDIVLSREQIMNMKMGGDITTKQYRTYNLVSTPWWGGKRTIKIMGYYGAGTGSYGLNYKERVGLVWAVGNYNALNLKIRFSLTWGRNYGPQDMLVYHLPRSGAGGVSGFPSGGKPYKWVRVWGLNGYSYNVNEHVITHEIGHAVGFRHTDYFNRASCGQNANEGSAGVGAVHIPGTPWGIDWNSVMLACFNANESGEFGYYDKVALNYLY